MAGSYDFFDSQQITADSEYDSRYGTAVRYLQIHHATMLSLSGLISLMQPGGREVSANGALGNDGHLVEVVPATQRAFTSGVAAWDRQCITVETCNTSLSPTWGISAASRERLAQLAVAMFRAGQLGALTREFIIGHNEVPGTYATSCPGPDMNLDWIVARANEIYRGGTAAPVSTGRITMRLIWAGSSGYLITEDGIHGVPTPQLYQLFYRVINSDQTKSPFVVAGQVPMNFNATEIDQMKQFLASLRVANGAQASPVDVAALAKLVSDATIAGIEAQLGELDVTVEVDYDKIAAEVDAALADNFATIPKDIISEIAS